MSHYYTPDPRLPHDIEVFTYEIKGKKLQFATDAGVFSRQKVDYGSNLLLNFLPPLEGRVSIWAAAMGP